MYDKKMELVRLSDTNVNVILPVPTIRLGRKYNDIDEEERYYIERRDFAKDRHHKVMFDRVRATLKYANSCGASLIKPSKTEAMGFATYQVTVFLNFHSKEETKVFLATAFECIDSATMD